MPLPLQTPCCLLLFFGIALGLAWPLTARLALDAAEKLVASVVLSLLGVFLVAWGIYVFALPLALFWALPLLAAGGFAFGRHALGAAWRDATCRDLLLGQLLVTAWCLGWLAVVASYGGGEWAADWFGHLLRTWFFLEHWPHDTLFAGFEPLPARPPLANLINGAFLTLTQKNFAHYQLFSTLFSSLAFLPAALLARRFGGRRAVAALAVLCMLNPLFVENAAYPWTKLPTAFFTLAALYFFLRAHDPDAPRAAAGLFAAALAGGLLAHYSAGPYAVVLAIAWFGLGWARRREVAWWRSTATAALIGSGVLATWFGWSFAIYGGKGTLLTNTSITDQATTRGGQLLVVAGNLRDTFVPHFLRAPDYSLFVQSSRLGWWRDWFFNLYQTNFFFAAGSVAWIAILILLRREWPAATRRSRVFWVGFVIAISLLGVAVHGGRIAWGIVYICLQPLVLLGLAFLAAHWNSFGSTWRRILVAGATLDFCLGLALQFALQSSAVNPGFAADRGTIAAVLGYSPNAQINLRSKLDNHWTFVGDHFAPYFGLVLSGLLLLFLFAAYRAARAPAIDRPNPAPPLR